MLAVMDRLTQCEVRCADIANWRQTHRGRQLEALECARLERVMPRLFGRCIIQVGSWGQGDRLIASAQMPVRGVLGLDRGAGEHAVSQSGALPLAKGVADAVLLPHSLEFAHSPHRLLREADRILTPRGHMLILGFNPLSWWGLRQRMGTTPALPRGARFLTTHRVCDWLHLLDFDVLDIHRFGVGLPWLTPMARSDGRRLQYVARLLAEAYLIVAKKRTIPVTPMADRWHRRQPDVAPALSGVRVSFEAAARRRDGR